MKKQPTFSLADQLFNTQTVSTLAGRFFKHHKTFPTQMFVDECVAKFPHLELKQRITHITHTLHQHLPIFYPDAVESILHALPPKLDPDLNDDDFGEFIVAPLAEYISTYGCTQKYLEISRHALTQITMRFSVEFAVRKFINTFPDQIYVKFSELAHSTNYHQRRLVSEGSRPRLPWAERIVWTPQQTMQLLDHLYADPTRYVTRSVANHLNDISKTDPSLVFQTLNQRHYEGKQDPSELEYIKTHALRSLIKSGHPKAFTSLGYQDVSHLQINTPKTSSEVVIGEHFELTFDLVAKTGCIGKCLIDYAIGYRKKNGTTRDTIYKIATIDSYQTTQSFSKRQPIRLMTTRALYPGTHTWKIRVNGVVLQSGSFELIVQ